MANLPINPATGQAEKFGGGSGFIKGARLQALEARSAATGFGKSDAGKEITGIKLLLAKIGEQDRSRQAKAAGFLEPIIDVVEDNADNFLGLKQSLGLIKQAESQLENAGFGNTDKGQIARALGLLRAFIQKQTTFKTRVKSSLKNVVKQKVENVKQGFIDNLQESPNFLKRVVGRQLNQRFGEAAKARQQQHLEARADVMENAATAEKSAEAAATGKTEDEWDSKGGRKGGAAQRLRGAMGAGGGGTDSKSGPTLRAILTTDKGILTQVTKLAEGQEEGANKAEQVEQAGERTAEGAAPTKVARVLAGGKDKKGKKEGGLLGMLSGMFGEGGLGGVLGKLVPALGGIATAAMTMVGPALTALGSVLAVVGAAFVGWKIGEWINKMTGASDKIGDAASWIYQKVTGQKTLGEQEKGAGQDEIDRAWKQGGAQKFAKKEHMSLDAARKVNADFANMSPEDRMKTVNAGKPATPAEAPPQPAPPPATPAPPPEPAPAERKTQEAVNEAPPTGLPKPTSPQRTGGDAKFDYDAYADALGKRESGGKYQAINTLGYVGKYQFGLMTLEDAGLVRPGTAKKRGQSKKTVQDPSIWTIPGGLAAFLNNPGIQEKAMREYTEKNRKTLTRLKVIGPNTTSDEVAGYLAASHLVGPGAVAKQGLSGKDAYGTSASSYFALASGTQNPASAVAVGGTQPSPARSAGTMTAATTMAQAGNAPNAGGTPVVTNIYNNTSTQQTSIQARINPDNDKAASLRALQGVSGMG